MAWGKLKRLQGRAGGSADAGNGGIPPDQFWHTSTQPGRANHLPEWVADNTGNVRRWREAQEVEQSEISQAANDPTVWGELTDQSIRFQGQWHDQETGLHYNRIWTPRISQALTHCCQEGKDCTRISGLVVARATVPDGSRWWRSYRFNALQVPRSYRISSTTV